MSDDRYIVSIRARDAAVGQGRLSPELASLLDRLRSCVFLHGYPMVGCSAWGRLGSRHVFSELFPIVNSRATPAELEAMLADPHPSVRILAAKCLLRRGEDPVSVAPLLADTAHVWVAAGGCSVFGRSVGYVIEQLISNPGYLD